MTVAAATPLVADIETLVADVQGWSPVDELYTLSILTYATAHLPGDLVEVGSWHGRSSIVLGAAARDTHGMVHCIDLFPSRDDWRMNTDGSYSFEVDVDGRPHVGYQDQTVWADTFESKVLPMYAEAPKPFDQFVENVRRSSLDVIVRPHRGTSSTFAAKVPASFQCRLLFLDGDHGYEAVKADIARLAPFLVPGGWICFDDAFSTYEGVDRAITEMVIENSDYDVKRQMTRKCFAARKASRA